ncbi:MAG: hypothetical protein CVV13_13560 [Gammaproteobacteria bacterium HGW-Gammaproteobacteria-3]|nr:MAG: hypothetical protein CVV13_13560 [Gammaproteobacteria bacterium HGW-Gammaproteobacteria-3]
MQTYPFKTGAFPDADIPILPQPETAEETRVESVFAIRIGSQGFLVPADKHCEVLDKIAVNKLPNVHSWISGILNVRGNLVPVFDLHIVLEESLAHHGKRKLFAIGRGHEAMALWIDGFPEIKDRATLSPLHELPALPQTLQDFAVCGYRQDGQLWLDIIFNDLFLALGQHHHATEGMAT